MPITECKRSLTMYVPQESSKRGLGRADSESTRIGVSGVQEGSLGSSGRALGETSLYNNDQHVSLDLCQTPKHEWQQGYVQC